ncbi:hypothetical protein [Pandoraea sp. NPDC087047]|uniref:hypothetical protein n=1 Tax=Pandoraea sp. NPDC087047 TaxID=3364390 RepID=UPI0037FF44F9
MSHECYASNAQALRTVVDSPLDDLLAGAGCVTFIEDDTQVRVGWLHAGGDGLIVTAHVDEGVAGRTRFWCDAQQWSDWLAPSLPVPSWDTLPPAWQASAASLTLATGRMSGDPMEAPAPLASWPQGMAIAREPVETAWRVGIVLVRDDRRLALQYLDGATSWLRERCQQATPGDVPLDPAGLPERRCPLVAGWAELPAALCDSQLDGGAVLLDVAADVRSGEYWLLDGEHAIAMRDGQPAGRRVVTLERRASGGHEDANAHPPPTCTRLFAVIAEGRIPIPWLMAWRAGHPAGHPAATANALAADRITLWRDGAPWASGRLLSFGDGCLAVQIDGTPASPDAPVDEISGGDPMGVHSATT